MSDKPKNRGLDIRFPSVINSIAQEQMGLK